MTQVLAKLVARSWLSPLWLVLTRVICKPSRDRHQTLPGWSTSCINFAFYTSTCFEETSARVLCTTPTFDAPLRVHQHHPAEHPLAATSLDLHTNTNTTWLHLLSENDFGRATLDRKKKSWTWARVWHSQQSSRGLLTFEICASSSCCSG